MRKLRKSDIVLIIGMVLLAAGAVISMVDMPDWVSREDWSNYLLIAGAIVVIIRGFIRNHEQ